MNLYSNVALYYYYVFAIIFRLQGFRLFARDTRVPDANYSCTLAFSHHCQGIRNGRGRFRHCPFLRI